MANTFHSEPTWYLGKTPLNNESSLEILGITFNKKGSALNHINVRKRKCVSSAYGLAGVGMSYPGTSSNVKAHLWKSVCQPVLLYGLEAVSLHKGELAILEKTQGSIIKASMGLGKRHHHSRLMKALEINHISSLVSGNCEKLYHKIFQEDSPTRTLNITFLVRYMATGNYTKGTLLERILQNGSNPMKVIFDKPGRRQMKPKAEDGVVDSLKVLLHSENFVKPWTTDHLLVSLLTQAF